MQVDVEGDKDNRHSSKAKDKSSDKAVDDKKPKENGGKHDVVLSSGLR